MKESFSTREFLIPIWNHRFRPKHFLVSKHSHNGMFPINNPSRDSPERVVFVPLSANSIFLGVHKIYCQKSLPCTLPCFSISKILSLWVFLYKSHFLNALGRGRIVGVFQEPGFWLPLLAFPHVLPPPQPSFSTLPLGLTPLRTPAP